MTIRTNWLVIAAPTRAIGNVHRAAVLEEHGLPVHRVTLVTDNRGIIELPHQSDDPAPAYVIDTGDHKVTAFLYGQLVARGFEPKVLQP